MKVSYPIPAKEISEVVEGMLVIEKDSLSSSFTLPLYANGKPTLLFQTAKGKIRNSENYLTLFGQTIIADQIAFNTGFTLIACFLQPVALTTLFGIPPQQLTDNPVSLDLLLPRQARDLEDRLLHACSTGEMIRLLGSFIFDQHSSRTAATNLMGNAARLIIENPSKEILTRVKDKLCVTERTFQRMFKWNVGVSPSQYRRIVQFHAAFEQLKAGQFNLFTDIAFRNNYSDQSHFIRTFKEFTNLTPKEYLKFSPG